jgi:hypothetical protein
LDSFDHLGGEVVGVTPQGGEAYEDPVEGDVVDDLDAGFGGEPRRHVAGVSNVLIDQGGDALPAQRAEGGVDGNRPGPP